MRRTIHSSPLNDTIYIVKQHLRKMKVQGWRVLPQNCSLLQACGFPPAWTHCREYSAMVLQRQKDLLLLVHWHMSDSQASMKESNGTRSVQLLKAGPESSCSHTDVWKHSKDDFNITAFWACLTYYFTLRKSLYIYMCASSKLLYHLVTRTIWMKHF